MSKFEQARKSSFFKMGDIFIYLFLVLMIVVLFIVTLTGRDTSALEKIEIVRDNKVILTYDFMRDKFSYSEGITITEEVGGYLVTIENGKEKNVLTIKKEGYIKMLEANCSTHRDCVYMTAITDQSGYIECMPHHLLIRSAGAISDDPIIG